MSAKIKATIEDLYKTKGKAELVNGEIVEIMPTGFRPSRASLRIAMSLTEFENPAVKGFALSDNAGFLVKLPRRESFSPDAAWHTGEPTGMKFLEGAPAFAVEVRSENDYGAQAERKI